MRKQILPENRRNNSNEFEGRNRQLNKNDDKINDWEIGTKWDTGLPKQGIYSPEKLKQPIPVPVIFPPPKLIDLHINEKALQYHARQHDHNGVDFEKENTPQVAQNEHVKPKRIRKKRRVPPLREEIIAMPENSMVPLTKKHHDHEELVLSLMEEESSDLLQAENEIAKSIMKEPQGRSEVEPSLLLQEIRAMLKEEIPSTDAKDSMEMASSPLYEESSEQGSEEAAVNLDGLAEVMDDWMNQDEELTNNTEDHESIAKESLDDQKGLNIPSEDDTSAQQLVDIPVQLSANPPIAMKQQVTALLPILLATIDVAIAFDEMIDIGLPIDEIREIDWELKSLVVQPFIPSATVFVKGVLVASIDYVNNASPDLRAIKFPIQLDEVLQVNWLAKPNRSSANENSYLFRNDDMGDTHREYQQEFAYGITDMLRKQKITWHHHFVQHETTKLELQGVAQITMDLLQQQYIQFYV